MSVESVSAMQIIRATRRHRRIFVVLLLAGMVLGLAHYLLAEPRYEARLLVLPSLHGDSSLMGMASDMAQLAGLNLGTKADLTLIYRDILVSDLILDRMLEIVPEVGPTSLGATLGGVATPEAREKAVRRLRRVISVSRDSRSRTVEIRVQCNSRELASALADSLGGALDAYLRETRRGDSNAQFQFLNSEADGASRALDTLETQLAEFQSRNRLIEQSPQLRREEALLRRDIMIKEAVLVELEKQAELSAMGMRRNVPSITLLERARTYSRPVYPKLAQSLVMGLGAAALLFVLYVVGRRIVKSPVADSRLDS